MNGRPAALVKSIGYLETGDTGQPTGQVKQSDATMLTWSRDDAQLSLIAGPSITDEDLIRMAESIE